MGCANSCAVVNVDMPKDQNLLMHVCLCVRTPTTTNSHSMLEASEFTVYTSLFSYSPLFPRHPNLQCDFLFVFTFGRHCSVHFCRGQLPLNCVLRLHKGKAGEEEEDRVHWGRRYCLLLGKAAQIPMCASCRHEYLFRKAWLQQRVQRNRG